MAADGPHGTTKRVRRTAVRAAATKYEPLCPVEFCPERSNPDWHSCVHCGAIAIEHHHTTSRGMGGSPSRKMDKKQIVPLCSQHHEQITLHDWGDAILVLPNGARVYRMWDLHGETIVERVLESITPPTISAAEEQNARETAGAALTSAAETVGREVEPQEEAMLDVARDDLLPDALQGQWVVGEASLAAPTASHGVLTQGYTPTGLVLPEGLDYEAWVNVGGTLRTMTESLAWWWGDWLNYGERKYGEKYSQAMDLSGKDYSTLNSWRWVAERIEFVRRRTNLSWSHHAEVATLEAPAQDEWLGRAQAEGMSRRELRLALKGEPRERERHDCPLCGLGHSILVKEEWRT